MHKGSPAGVFVGLATLDVIHRVERMPHANEKITARSQFVAAGGPAANAAVTFAALGGRAKLVTALGASPIAGAIAADLADCGVEVVDVAPALPRTSVSSVVVTDATGERAVVGGDAADVVVPEPAKDDVAGLLVDADVVLIDGHHATLAVTFSAAATKEGVPVVVDAGRWRPVFGEVFAHATDVVASADFRVPDVEALGALPTHLADRGIRVVVTTAGEAPVRWRAGAHEGQVEVDAVDAVDTLGAGDVFHGAYAYSLAVGVHDVRDRVSYAAAVASKRCTMVGPRSWLSAISSIRLPGGGR